MMLGVWSCSGVIHREKRITSEAGEIDDRLFIAALRNSAPALIALAREALAARKLLVPQTGRQTVDMHCTEANEMDYIQIRTANETKENSDG